MNVMSTKVCKGLNSDLWRDTLFDFLLTLCYINQSFLVHHEKKLKAQKLKNSETQGKKLKNKLKTQLFGIFVEKKLIKNWWKSRIFL